MDADNGRMPKYHADPWMMRSPYDYTPSDVEPIEPTLQPKSVQPKSDPVRMPTHYARWTIEPIRFIEENGLEFWQGNVIKYTMRWRDKDGLQDLKKARRYLDMKIKQLEGDPEWWK